MKPETILRKIGSQTFFGTNSCMLTSVYANFKSDSGKITDAFVILSIRNPIGKHGDFNKYFEFDKQTGKPVEDKKSIKLSDVEVQKLIMILKLATEISDPNELVNKLKETPGLTDFITAQNRITFNFYRKDAKTGERTPYSFSVQILPPAVINEGTKQKKLVGHGVSFVFINNTNSKPEYVYTVRSAPIVNNIVSYLEMFDKMSKEINTNTPARYFYEEQFRKRQEYKNIVQDEIITTDTGVEQTHVEVNPEEEQQTAPVVPVVITENDVDEADRQIEQFLSETGFISQEEPKEEQKTETGTETETKQEQPQPQQKKTYYGEKGKGTFTKNFSKKTTVFNP